MEETVSADKTVYPILQKEQNLEETHEMAAKDNPESPVGENLKSVQVDKQNVAPPSERLISFLFWSNFLSVLLLLVGFVAPGWFTLTADEQQLQYIPSSYSGRTLHIQDVYQDYALWYVIQCYPHDGTNIECETMTYRTIADVYAEESTNYVQLKIGKIENEGADKFMFHGAALVFGNSKFVQLETMYTIGLLISLLLLYRWYHIRKEVVKGTYKGPGKWMWIFLILLTVLAVVLVFIVVFTCVGIRGSFDEWDAKLGRPFGLLFAVFGEVLLVAVGVTELIQVLSCLNIYTLV